MKKFEVFEHTADIGVRAKGEDLDAAFENAASGMFDIITDLDRIQTVGEYRVDIEAQDIEQLLVDWLSELLYLHTVKRVMFSGFNVEVSEDKEKWSLKGRASGEYYDEKKHPYHTEIKAVTHHMLQIDRNDEWKIQVLFDI